MNLNEAGDWNIYFFDDYRAGSSVIAPNFIEALSSTHGDEHFSFDVSLRLHGQSWSKVRTHNLSVVFAADHRLDYFAAAHPETKPDFHAKEVWRGRIR